ncbi:hypothetical protein K1719_047465 [Acacia pycnantha]|nr:hypothetical protein K1719_047465 [Acacia pycnantha]
MNSQPAVRRISECFIKPPLPSNDSNPICYLSPWDLLMLSAHYIQKGLLFLKPSPHNYPLFIDSLLNRLKRSLSLTLLHFYPLAGRLVTTRHPPTPSSSIANTVTALNLSTPLNHDGHTLPLLSVQVTELIDGVFIGCTMNHCLGDGTSYWRFFNAWSEIFRALEADNNDAKSVAKLKAKANRESNITKISSFQSLSALVWRCITRARSHPRDQRTRCTMAANHRSRIEPPLPEEYFGNVYYPVAAETTSGSC